MDISLTFTRRGLLGNAAAVAGAALLPSAARAIGTKTYRLDSAPDRHWDGYEQI